MSKPYANFVAWPLELKALAAGALALTLAACGSSAPRQAEVDVPREAVVAPAEPVIADADTDVSRRAMQGAIADAAAPRERSRDRRSERRAKEDADAAEAAVTLPVPETAVAGYARALEAMRAGNWLEAELELEQLTLEHPEYPGPHVNLALVYLNDGRRDEARAALGRALEIEPAHAAANTQLGILLREDGEFASAEAAYRRALETTPDHALAHYNLAVLLDIYLRRPAEALEHYEAYQAMLSQPNETVARWIIDLRRRSGNAGAARVAQEDGR